MSKVFNMINCWGCGEPVVPGCSDGPYTVGCPGCDPQTPLCEKQADMDDLVLLHPDLVTWPDEVSLSMDLELLRALNKVGNVPQ